MKKEQFPVTIKKGNSVVKIYQNRNGEYTDYRVAYYHEGKRKRETYPSFTKARTRADEINDSFNSGNIEALNLTTNERVIFAQAMDLLRPIGESILVALSNYIEARRIVGSGGALNQAADLWAKRNKINIQKKKLPEILEEYLESRKQRGLNPKDRYSAKVYVKRLLDMCQCDIESIDRELLQKFFDSLNHLSVKTKHFARGYISTFFTFAKKRNYLAPDWNELSRVELPKLQQSEITIYSPKEVADLLQNCPERIRHVIAIKAFAGLRTSEVLQLEWEQIGARGGGYIELRAGITKKRQRRLIPITDNLASWLSPYKKLTGPIWNRSKVTYHQVVNLWARDGVFKLKDNALRHSYISYRMAQTSDAAKVSLEAGNSPQMVFSNYREVVSLEEANQWFSVMPGNASDKIIPMQKEAVTIKAARTAVG